MNFVKGVAEKFVASLKKAKDKVAVTKSSTSRSGGGGEYNPYSSNTPMKYPYTLSAKIAQFPYKFYFQNQWIARYYVFAVVLCIPVFKFISNLANSPGNVKKWEEQQRKNEHHDDE